MKTYGRTTIYSKYTEEQLLSGSLNDQVTKVQEILTNAILLYIYLKILLKLLIIIRI